MAASTMASLSQCFYNNNNNSSSTKRDRPTSLDSHSEPTMMAIEPSVQDDDDNTDGPSDMKRRKLVEDSDAMAVDDDIAAPSSSSSPSPTTGAAVGVAASPKSSPKLLLLKKNRPTGPGTTPFFHYTDFSQQIDPDPLTPLTAPGRVPNFPAKMHSILSRPELRDVICWMPHGRSWKVLKPREFEIRVLPTYFEHAKFSSFIRQANGWGFRRLQKGPDRNSYYHEVCSFSTSLLVCFIICLKIWGRPPFWGHILFLFFPFYV